jgi:hypothetical protein
LLDSLRTIVSVIVEWAYQVVFIAPEPFGEIWRAILNAHLLDDAGFSSHRFVGNITGETLNAYLLDDFD